MAGYTKLDSGILDSTVWQAPDRIRLVWMTMLAMADQNGYVGASVPGLAARAVVPIEDCLKALKLFMEPDEYSRTKDHDGRRIVEAEGGWVLVNYKKYREMRNADEARERSRVAMAKLRQKRKAKASPADVNPGEGVLTPVNEVNPSRSISRSKHLKTSPPSLRSGGVASVVDQCPDAPAGGQEYQVPKCPHADIIAIYHELLPTAPRMQIRTKARDSLMQARWREVCAEGKLSKEEGLNAFRVFFGRQVAQSKFLTGRAQPRRPDERPFKADLEWLMRPTNFVKVLEGKYSDD